jgi:extradiol dioxygenase family protein
MKLERVYRLGIPLDDLDRTSDFYGRKVLGTEYPGDS